MMIGILKKGDHVINVTPDFVAVERKDGTVDIVPITKEEGRFRIDTENILTIGFGDNVIQTQDGDVTVTTF